MTDELPHFARYWCFHSFYSQVVRIPQECEGSKNTLSDKRVLISYNVVLARARQALKFYRISPQCV